MIHFLFLIFVYSSSAATPEHYFKLAEEAEKAKDFPKAVFLYNQSIGSVIKDEDIQYAVISVARLSEISMKVGLKNQWMNIDWDDSKAIMKLKGLKVKSWVEEEDMARVYGDHPSFQAIVAANLLMREAENKPHMAVKFLLLALFVKRDYPPVYLALSKQASKMQNYPLALEYATEYRRRAAGARLTPEFSEYLLGLNAHVQSGPAEKDSDASLNLRELKKRLKKEQTASLYYQYALALLKDDPERREIKKYLEKAHELEPENEAVLLTLAETTREQKRKTHELVGDLLALYEKQKSAALLFQAVRLSAEQDKANLAKMLIKDHTGFEQGYQCLSFLKLDEAMPILKETEWHKQGEPIQASVFSYLKDEGDPKICFDFLGSLSRSYPNHIGILNELLTYSDQMTEDELASYKAKHKDLLLPLLQDKIREGDLYSYRDFKTKGLFHGSKEVIAARLFMKNINRFKNKEMDLFQCVDLFPEVAFYYVEFGNWMLETEKNLNIKSSMGIMVGGSSSVAASLPVCDKYEAHPPRWYYKKAWELDPKRPDLKRMDDRKNKRDEKAFYYPYYFEVERDFANKADDDIRQSAFRKALLLLGLQPEDLAPVFDQRRFFCDNDAIELLDLFEGEDLSLKKDP